MRSIAASAAHRSIETRWWAGLPEAAQRAGQDLRFVVECDTGMGRTGVQTPAQAFELARAAM